MAFNLGGIRDFVGGVFGAPDGKGGKVGNIKLPKFAMKDTNSFIKDEKADQLGGGESIAKRFNMQREKVQGAQNASLGQNTTAIQRRFAAMGSSGSGAQMKMEQQAANQADEARNAAFGDLATQEEGATQARESAQADLNFRQKVFNFERGSKLHELDLAERQQQIDRAATEFNARVAQEQTKQQRPGLVGSILS